MDLYNQFMAGPSDQQAENNGTLETGMGNLSLSDNSTKPLPKVQQTRNDSVDLYEWDGNVYIEGIWSK